METEIGPIVATASWRADSSPFGRSTWPEQVAPIFEGSKRQSISCQTLIINQLMKARCLDIIIKSIRKMLPIYCVGHKDGIFFRFNNMIETYCFFFGSFINLEQVNDYVMILEYQGEINICKILCYVS